MIKKIYTKISFLHLITWHFVMRTFFPKFYDEVLDDIEKAEDRMFWFHEIGIDRPIEYYLEQQRGK